MRKETNSCGGKDRNKEVQKMETKVNIASVKGTEDCREKKRKHASDTQPRTSSVNND